MNKLKSRVLQDAKEPIKTPDIDKGSVLSLAAETQELNFEILFFDNDFLIMIKEI
jgi:hypothetical protein